MTNGLGDGGEIEACFCLIELKFIVLTCRGFVSRNSTVRGILTNEEFRL